MTLDNHPSDNGERVLTLPNNTYVVNTKVGPILVNCPPETLKYLLAQGLKAPKIVLLPPDMPGGQQLGSSGFVRQGINYASVEFIMYANFFGAGGVRTHLITPTSPQAYRLRRILEETVDGPNDPADYGPYPWLQQECSAVAHFPPLGRAPQVNDLVTFANLETGGGNLDEVQIHLDGDHFVFVEDGQIVAKISTTMRGTPAPLAVAPPRPLLRQEITLQFIGGSDGFDPAGITTCFLAYLGPNIHTQATLFDTAAYLRVRLGNLGISPSQISEVVLSHLHEDHLAGLPELLLMGQQRVRLLTSDVIYRSLLRVLSAMLAVPEVEAATLFDHYPLNPGQPISLEGRRFEAIYAIHSIPTIAVRANSLCYSGDMRYDEEWFTELERQEVLTTKRRVELMTFFDGASILVQDAGGGAIHTTVTPALLKSLASKSQRLILAHTSKHLLPADQPELAAHIEFASSGHVSAMGEAIETPKDVEPVETLSACTLFARLPVAERIALAEKAGVEKWEAGQVILREGDPSDGMTYVVHSGLIEVWSQGTLAQVIGRGNSLGERGALRDEPRTSSVIARGPVELLSLPPDVFLPVAEKLGLPQAFNRAEWLWKQPAFEHLPWATLLDLALDFEPRRFETGQPLFEHGGPGHECYLLVSGAVAITDQQGRLIEEMTTPGGFFGGRAALYKQPRNASAHATQASEVWVLPAPALQRLQMVYPNVLLHLRVIEATRYGLSPADKAAEV